MAVDTPPIRPPWVYYIRGTRDMMKKLTRWLETRLARKLCRDAYEGRWGAMG